MRDHHLTRGSALALGCGVTASGVTLSVLSEVLARGAIHRNRFTGIRTGSTMRSEETWRVAHRAARPFLHLTGMAWMASGILFGVRRISPAIALYSLGTAFAVASVDIANHAANGPTVA